MGNEKLFIGIIGIVVGGVAGYFFGSYQATQSINAQIATRQQAQTGVNPFKDIKTNPLEDVKTNPYKDIKTNPFE